MTDSLDSNLPLGDPSSPRWGDTPDPNAWDPSEADLADWARILMQDAYLQRGRTKCSRDDFEAGFLGALVALRWRPAFKPLHDHRPFPDRFAPLPALVEAFVRVGPKLTETTNDQVLADAYGRRPGSTPDQADVVDPAHAASGEPESTE